MTDAQKTKLPYLDRLNPRYGVNAGTEEKRKQGQRWAALNEYVRRNGGAVTSVAGNKTLRVEVPKGSELPARLRELGYNVSERGTVTRVTGAPSVSADAAPHRRGAVRLRRNGRA